MLTTLLGLLLALLIGLSLGLLGGGGSILTVPVLVYVLGFAAKPAIAMTLPIVGTASLVGAVGHWRDGNVNLRVALLFGLAAMAGAYGGARVAAYVTGAIFDAYRVFALPTQFFVDPDGVIRQIVNGPVDEARAVQLVEAILPLAKPTRLPTLSTEPAQP